MKISYKAPTGLTLFLGKSSGEAEKWKFQSKLKGCEER
jgi:hypothetical protein